MGNVLDLVEVAHYRSASAERWFPSLGTEYKDNAHNTDRLVLKKRPECKRRYLVESFCGHGNSFWWAKNCDSWRCSECTAWRVETEIRPEIRRAILWARRRGETLKFITPTWRSSDLGAQPTPEGKKRRKLDRQHLVQALRRDRGLFFEYARVPEQHKSGKFHEHWLAVTDYLNEDALQDQWLKHTRGSSFNVKVQAVALRCPECWPGRNADSARKEKSRIIPPPGVGKCRNCGFEPDWLIPSWWEELADQAAAELSKYLVKTAQSGITGKLLSRSKGWRENCRKNDSEEIEEPTSDEPDVCKGCGTVHSWRFIGPLVKLAGSIVEHALTARLVMEAGRVYRYGPTGPCGCWTPPDEEQEENNLQANFPDGFETDWEYMTQSNFLNLFAQNH